MSPELTALLVPQVRPDPRASRAQQALMVQRVQRVPSVLSDRREPMVRPGLPELQALKVQRALRVPRARRAQPVPMA